ncbi:sensor histidine kinase [Pedobacter heparinus]|uniref:sensor histidine kinase n=1 Tax=Pedobacter heparinus TaxID=984 RepID=UPI00292D3519|nr:sensor histidine kinase [Pedobacter heparinus]
MGGNGRRLGPDMGQADADAKKSGWSIHLPFHRIRHFSGVIEPQRLNAKFNYWIFELMETTNSTFTSLLKQGIRIHLTFLLGLMLLTVAIILQSPDNKRVAPKALLVYVLMVMCVYAGRWLSRQLFKKWKPRTLILLFCFFLCLFAVAGIFGVACFLGFKDGDDVSGLVVITTLLVILFMFVGGITAITRMVTRQQIRESKVLQYQAETELNLLTSKLSPHFLFNTLHNLYGLSRQDHTRVPDLLLKLSDLLSYTLYSSGEPFVKLSQEVDCVQNFVALERIRIGNRLVLEVNFRGYDPASTIAPMILIVFVENAFKHTKNTLSGPIKITMKLWTEAGFTHFEIENTFGSFPDEAGTLDKTGVSGKPSGMGLATTIKRLDLLYGKGCQLEHGRIDDRYVVKLKTPMHAAH